MQLSNVGKNQKERNVEMLLSNESNMAQEWFVECGGPSDTNGPNGDEEVEVQPNLDAHW